MWYHGEKAEFEKGAPMEKPHLSKVIDYYRDIEPYGFIQIHSGVGSGKNTFIEKLIKGYPGKREDGTEYTVPPKTVLLITSRRAKVDEIKKDKKVGVGTHVLEWENGCAVDDIEKYLASERQLPDLDGWGEASIHQRSIACTNAAIETYLQNHYIPTNAYTHLWQRFDFIVLDEAHSVLADASYQSAPYYVHSLVNKAHREYKNGNSKCKVIVMTGSPGILSDFRVPEGGNHIDLMDTCKNVVPQRVSFVDTIEAKKDMQRRLANGERVIYFCNHIKPIFAMYGELSPELQEATAFSFSQEERLDVKDPEQKKLYDRMKGTESAIATNQQLPDNIKLLLTTSRNKEGINIKNKDIKAMYVETHAEVDIIQMAGRVREGLDTLYIVTDSSGFGKTESDWEHDFTRLLVPIDAIELSEEHSHIKELNLVEFCNHFFWQLLRGNKIDLKDEFRGNTYGYEKAGAFIDFIHSKFPFIRYDYFKDQFVFYSDRRRSQKYYKEQGELYKEAAKSKSGLEELAQTWFEDIPVVWPEDRQSQVERYLTENKLVGVPLSKEQQEQVKDGLSEIVGKTVKQLNNILNDYGYKTKDSDKHPDRPLYGYKEIAKM